MPVSSENAHDTGAYQDVGAARLWSIFEVQADEMLGQPSVVGLIRLVQDQVQEVETGDEGGRQVDVACDGPFEIVLASDWVRCSQD